jgi:predicted metal-binding membrane protein
MGVKHGAWCVGCCWALFVALFALGVMSVFWMVVVVAIIAAERLLPWKLLARSAAAVLLVVLGLGVAFAPGSVPNFTDPSHASGMRMKGHSAP